MSQFEGYKPFIHSCEFLFGEGQTTSIPLHSLTLRPLLPLLRVESFVKQLLQTLIRFARYPLKHPISNVF